MLKKNNNTTTSRPHVKWGTLILAIISAVLGLIPLVLNFLVNTQMLPKIANSDLELFLGFIAGYGWCFAILAFLFSSASITEDFIPSIIAAKKWDAKKAKEKKIRAEKNRQYEDFMNSFDFSSLH